MLFGEGKKMVAGNMFGISKIKITAIVTGASKLQDKNHRCKPIK
jgi:hypothetical protein